VVRDQAPGGRHAWVLGRVCTVLDRLVQAAGDGTIYVEVGVVIRTDPGTVRVPDLALFTRGRVADPWPDGFFRTIPDLAVEIVSPSNRRKDVLEKVAEYLGGGGRMAWVIDPRRRTLEVHRPASAVLKLGEADELDGSDVSPGLRLRVADIFARPPGY
jgi:Uma2 family endonuclease